MPNELAQSRALRIVHRPSALNIEVDINSHFSIFVDEFGESTTLVLVFPSGKSYAEIRPFFPLWRRPFTLAR